MLCMTTSSSILILLEIFIAWNFTDIKTNSRGNRMKQMNRKTEGQHWIFIRSLDRRKIHELM
jgi:hypothetical protein